MRFVISEGQPLRAGAITWQLAQTFWVGGLWLLQFVVLPALGKIGLAPLLIHEVASSLRPLLIGFAAFCAVLQLLVLVQVNGLRSILKDVRGQLLLAVLALAASYFVVQAGFVRFDFWLLFSYLVIALGGLMLVVQPPPGRER